MAEIIINKEKHECAPAVTAYVKELDKYNKALLSDIAKKLEEIAALEAENARLEESFQKATGAVAADALPTLAEMRKVSEMCKHNKCKSKDKKCPYFNTESSHCRFENGADFWDFGGADDDKP